MDKELKDLLREVSQRLLIAQMLYDSYPYKDERENNLRTLEKVQAYLTKNKLNNLKLNKNE